MNETPLLTRRRLLLLTPWLGATATQHARAGGVAGTPQSAAAASARASTTAPLLEGLAGYSLRARTRLPLVQRYVDQGAMLVYGFNPAEAARSFQAATALDPCCAIAWWGLAWSLGPNINTDMAPSDAERVHHALQQASRHARLAEPLHRDWIAALALRHPAPERLDEQAYEQRMRVLTRRYPRSADTALLAAEALLNLHPYDWWGPAGEPLPATPRIESLLQQALRLMPGHPGAHHYWIHLQESSPRPQRGVASADALRGTYPGSGHLLHMPSHIDMRVGRYADAIRANRQSIAADLRYLEQVDAQGAYRVGYVAHNHHFLWAAACMAGQPRLALEAAEAAWPAACGPGRRDPGLAITSHYAALPFFTRVRFGQWRAMLHDTPPPDTPGPYALALWHYARGTALAQLGQPEAAQAELQALEKGAADPAIARLRVKNIHAAAVVLRMASVTLRGDLALAAGQTAAAVTLLQQATQLEDGLQYDEPHLWLAPTRQALGAVLLAAGRPQEAERVYRQDLAHYPGNGWSLTGLAQAQAATGQAAAAQATQVAARLAFEASGHVPKHSRF